jgi:ketosteroid isomerase-like protein
MKSFLILILVLIVTAGGFAQNSDLQKLVETEQAFANLAAERGTKHAFLENMTDDAVVFTPDRTLAKPFWAARGESASLLSWAPNFAAISSSGLIGYTTGNWEFRPKGKDDAPAGFGDFITVWQRQPDGRYKWVIDIGIGHEKPAKYSTEWTTYSDKIIETNENKSSAADFANRFYELAGSAGLMKAYKQFAADDIRLYREGEFPAIGKAKIGELINKDKGKFAFAKRTSFFGSADLAYINNSYTVAQADGKVVKGNFLQIWRLRNGRWQIVLDIFKPAA